MKNLSFSFFVRCKNKNPCFIQMFRSFICEFESLKSFCKMLNLMRCAIWYHLYNLKNVKSTHGGALSLVKLQALACSFTKINNPPWVFFTFFKFYKQYQSAQRVTNMFFSVWFFFRRHGRFTGN